MRATWLRAAPLTLAIACARGEEGGVDTTAADSAPPAAVAPGDTTPAVTTPGDSAPRDTTGPAPKGAPPRPPAPTPTTPKDDTAAAARDTARGVVRIVGSLPVNVSVVLAPEGATSPIRLTGQGATALRALGGVEVVVRGSRTPSGALDVQSFTVRSVNGEPAVDGVIVAEGDGLAIETERGRQRLGNPPDAFRGMVGARVWITGPLDRGPNTYGVIRR